MIRVLLDCAGDLAEAFALFWVIAFIIAVCVAMQPDPTPVAAMHAHGPVLFAKLEP